MQMQGEKAMCRRRQPGVMRSHAKACGRPGSWSRPGTDSPPEGTDPANTLISDFWPRDSGRIHFCCFKRPSLWCFVMRATGH